MFAAFFAFLGDGSFKYELNKAGCITHLADVIDESIQSLTNSSTASLSISL